VCDALLGERQIESRCRRIVAAVIGGRGVFERARRASLAKNAGASDDKTSATASAAVVDVHRLAVMIPGSLSTRRDIIVPAAFAGCA
jgi:hypothetical protein